MKRLAAVTVALTCLVGVAACSGESGSGSSADPVEVEVGKAFEWNGFAVEDGWKIEGIERSINMEQVTTPEVSGVIVNKSGKKRAAIFQFVFSTDGDPIAEVNCSAATMIQDQSMKFLCPGLNTVMPEGYDTVVVHRFVRETGMSDDSSDSS